MKLNVLKVCELIAEQHRPLADVARAAGMPPTNMSKVIKRGACNLSTIGRIADALGVEPSDIWIMEE